MDDEKIIELFFARSELAVAELDTKYGGACRRLSYNILNDDRDAEECVNDAYLGTWNTIPPQRPNPLLSFVCRIVRNLSIKRYHANRAKKRSCEYEAAMSEIGDLAPGESAQDVLEARELARMIEQCLDGLTAENRVIFMRRYWFSDDYAAIAARVGLSEKNVSVRLVRLRRQLRDYLARREVYI